ncbi:PREDICTED: lipid transfer-like protein VAS [Nelumbo nucifera]|uniref:Lipid transfer-like protein VAS n=2 Tax=Nelumbo nucifera TaxID=4432 RepID=A0A1U8AAC0_NELNU|nr:PREDICTED: lipid transfer-like protein VAS [Nelumbo nucifera]DAD18599.1 TPA_asm: hypothetical protein HUJ06_020062 [Nelumbo nucifera]
MGRFKKSDVGALVLVVLATWLSLVGGGSDQQAEEQNPECAAPLLACAKYLNSTSTPPESCCNAVQETIRNQFVCLCNFYKSGLPQSLGINVTQALELPKSCGVKTKLTGCSNVAASSASSPSVPPPSPQAESDGSGAASKIAWTGMWRLLLLWISVNPIGGLRFLL